MNPTPNYLVQQLADSIATSMFTCKRLFLPVVHLELNPIEIVSRFIKRKVNFKEKEAEKLKRTEIARIGPKQIKIFSLHAIRELYKYRKYSKTLKKQENGSEYEKSEESVSGHSDNGTESDCCAI